MALSLSTISLSVAPGKPISPPAANDSLRSPSDRLKSARSRCGFRSLLFLIGFVVDKRCPFFLNPCMSDCTANSLPS